MTNRRRLRNILKNLEQGPAVNQHLQYQPKVARPPPPPRPQRYRQPTGSGWQSAIKVDLARRNAGRTKSKPSASRTAARLNFKTLWDKSEKQNNQNVSPISDLSISFKHPTTTLVDKWPFKNRAVQPMDTLSSFNPPLCSSKANEGNIFIDDSMGEEAPPHSERIRPEAGHSQRGRKHSVLLDFETTRESTVVHQPTLDSETDNVSSTTSYSTFEVLSRRITLSIQSMPSISIEPAAALLKPSLSQYMEICQAADNSLVSSGSMLYTAKFTGTYEIKKKAQILELQMRKMRSTALSRSRTLFSSPTIASELPGNESIDSFIRYADLELKDVDECMQSWIYQKEDDTVWPDTPKSQRQLTKKVKHDAKDDFNMVSSILAKRTMVRFIIIDTSMFKLFNFESVIPRNIINYGTLITLIINL